MLITRALGIFGASPSVPCSCHVYRSLVAFVIIGGQKKENNYVDDFVFSELI